MIREGETAPEFVLPGTDGEAFSQYRLSEYTETGPVVLAFYPFDFSPVCTEELCGFRDAEWLTIDPQVDVFGISTDSCYSHDRFIDEYGLAFSLLSDTTGDVAEQYGLVYEELDLHRNVPQRAVVIVDADRTIRHVWTAADACESPDIENLGREVTALIEESDSDATAEREKGELSEGEPP